tara:strand:- start:560 stop:1489 length:930 start_codon:yes stop_codon:yes gene_type:complete
MWIYSSGFPKSQDVGRSIERSKNKQAERTKSAGYNPSGENKPVDTGVNGFRCYTCGKDSAARYGCKNDPCQLHPPLEDDEAQKWNGWGTALKPAHEPIALARKPIKGSIRDNVVKHGTGAINIDATRVPIQGTDTRSGGTNGHSRLTFGEGITSNEDSHIAYQASEQGRFPSNVIGEILQDDYQKYFYCPKVSRRERHAGFDLTTIPTDPSGKYDNGGYSANQETLKASGNNHPTVKPIELMKYLIKLVTPPNGIVLDPFNGSGSTGCAAVELGCEYVGIELDPKYVEIATKRIEAWNKEDTAFKEIFE